jgi:hypothetical protein
MRASGSRRSYWMPELDLGDGNPGGRRGYAAGFGGRSSEDLRPIRTSTGGQAWWNSNLKSG